MANMDCWSQVWGVLIIASHRGVSTLLQKTHLQMEGVDNTYKIKMASVVSTLSVGITTLKTSSFPVLTLPLC